jgi:hypothetical protein
VKCLSTFGILAREAAVGGKGRLAALGNDEMARLSLDLDSDPAIAGGPGGPSKMRR